MLDAGEPYRLSTLWRPIRHCNVSGWAACSAVPDQTATLCRTLDGSDEACRGQASKRNHGNLFGSLALVAHIDSLSRDMV
jgi:hypothetical protein